MTGSQALQTEVDGFISRLRLRQVVGSWPIALETALLLRQVVSSSRWANVHQLLKVVREVSSRLVAAQPTELVVGNVCRRVMQLIREEYQTALQPETSNNTASSAVGPRLHGAAGATATGSGTLSTHGQHQYATTSSMFTLFGNDLVAAMRVGADTADSVQDDDDSNHNDKDDDDNDNDATSTYRLKPNMIQAIQEYIDELENVYVNVAGQVLDHIHSNEIILTIGKSRTVEQFLRHAAKKRRFQVVVAESAPSYIGHEQAAALVAAGIETTVIPDAAIFAVMSRMNKVVIGAHGVFANGGLSAIAGSRAATVAARHHHVPVVVCCGVFKFSPVVPFDASQYTVHGAPDAILPFEEDQLIKEVQVLQPRHEYVPPESIDLFITNIGAQPRSFIGQLLVEQYNSEDIEL
ncbi:hypothetical protein BDF19DRAFT_440590 [Syncephalis fuscata]|nr:hypothetical protein BDF19DRAFT_440590 [Syncephalis fuscata]